MEEYSQQSTTLASSTMTVTETTRVNLNETMREEDGGI